MAEIASYPAVIVTILLVLVFIILGSPIFISLGLASVVGVLIARGVAGLGQLPGAMYAQLDSFILCAVPLFILMGEILAYTGIGRDIYEVFSRWLYRVPGGLAIASIYTCAMFGAMCGVSIAGVAAIGPLAVPEMLKRKYDPRLAAGAVTAAGALAILIPPSIMLVIYGSIAFVSVGKLFIGGIVPGLVLASMMAIYVLIRVGLNPSLAPRIFETMTWRERLAPLLKLGPAAIMIFLVLGSIYLGVATPTEAAAVGVVGALLIGRFIYRSLSWKTFYTILTATTRASISILIICACALGFGNFLSVVRVPEVLTQTCLALPIGPLGIVFIFMAGLVVLGMFVDGISMVVITTPILLPVLLLMGYDPIWYGIILTINIEIAVITPPVGLNLYTMKSVAPELDIGSIIAGTLPYVAIDFICLSFFVLLPQLVLWLPSTM